MLAFAVANASVLPLPYGAWGGPWGGAWGGPWAAPYAHGATYLAAGPAYPAAYLAHSHAHIHAHEPVIVAAAPATYVAANRGIVHTAPLPGHAISATSLNLDPAPGTL